MIRLEKILSLLTKIVPEGIKELERRYIILEGIDRMHLIGRRKLSQIVNVPERVLRSDTDYMKEEGLIQVTGAGMSITKDGEEVLHGLTELMDELKGNKHKEEAIAKLLGGVKVIIVPGHTDEDVNVKKSIGRAAAQVLYKMIKESTNIAITGGSTVASMVDQVKGGTSKEEREITVLPARGGLGKLVELQANTLASTLAKKIGAKYRLLNVPDNLSAKAFESVQKEPEIKEIKEQLEQTDLLIFGIGNASEMATRRKLNEKLIHKLAEKKAVGEAFGYYFNEDGQIVYRSRTIGIDLETMSLPLAIAVAGGAMKAKAILAIKKYLVRGYLIIDEGAAEEILRLNG